MSDSPPLEDQWLGHRGTCKHVGKPPGAGGSHASTLSLTRVTLPPGPCSLALLGSYFWGVQCVFFYLGSMTVLVTEPP